ncbi:peroxiredoxin family protein [Granulicella cerasi]|uniref:Peroxiredoxin family protein n=1 Tax=Granulicella cerasi TaxID=741063 RepID=A0ABW1Z565_9BACT|nr:hypothetical protein [Granulicella cerasi]
MSLKGKVIHQPGMALGSGHKNLLLVVSTQCHFCQASLPFYKRLAPAATSAGVHTVAFLPDDANTAGAFLENGGIKVDAVQSIQPSDIGVHATPTIILTDDTGKVIKDWDGQLSSARESEVLTEVAKP